MDEKSGAGHRTVGPPSAQAAKHKPAGRARRGVWRKRVKDSVRSRILHLEGQLCLSREEAMLMVDPGTER